MTLAQDVFDLLLKHKMKLVTAESCTGGMVAAALTDLAGSSQVFERGFVTYSNEAKTECLGVTAELIKKQGAVSKEVALAMAEGALLHSRADIAISITGIAGPTGGSIEKPVGLVHFGVARKGLPAIAEHQYFDTNLRAEIRRNATEFALSLVHRQLKATP